MLTLIAALALQAQPAQPAPAAPSPPPADDTIVVTGQLPVTPAEARRQVNTVISTHEGQIARFFGAVCPTVIGPEPAMRRVIALRMRAVAAEAGVEVAPPGCRANVALIIVPNGPAFVRALRAARPALFATVEAGDLRRTLAQHEPVLSWNSTEEISEDGFAVNPESGTLQVRSASIISEPTRLSTVQAVVVVEERAADGKSLGQLADYAVMRAIAGARPPNGRSGAPPSTILALFDRGVNAPLELTRFDRAYLRALYRSRANQRSMAQMAQMSRIIAQEAAREAEDETAADGPEAH
jgi:hypothetical protein